MITKRFVIHSATETAPQIKVEPEVADTKVSIPKTEIVKPTLVVQKTNEQQANKDSQAETR